MTKDELRTKLAAIEHERWSAWQRWMHERCGTKDEHGNLTIPASLVQRWSRQYSTAYSDLSLGEQKSDMEQVDRYWPLIEEYVIGVARETVQAMAVAQSEARRAAGR